MFRRIIRIASSLITILVVMGFPSGRMVYGLTAEERNSVNLDTVWYVPLNSSACGGATSTTLSGSDNVAIAFNFLRSKGLTPNQAAGFVGNLVAESGVNPRKVEIAYSDPPHLSDSVPPNVNSRGQPGYGLAQWTAGRKDTLRAFAAANFPGKPESDMEMQLNYLWSELEAPYYNRLVLVPVRASTTLEEATNIVLTKFEAPQHPNLTQRVGFAQAVLDQVGGSAVPTAPGAPATPTIQANCLGAVGTGQNTQFVDGFTVYSQYDPDWVNLPYGSSTIGDSGCGPSAMAMIITALGTIVTPVETASYAASQGIYVPGVGSSWSVAPVLAQRWGLRAEAIGLDLQRITQTLQNGGLVISSGQGPVPFTSGGHYIVIRGVTADGKFKVGDSAHASANTTDWDPNVLLSSMQSRAGSVYAITR